MRLNLPLNENLENKVIVITGAAGVLCSMMSKELARQKARVALLDINIEKANDLVKEINQVGGDSIAIKCNVLDKKSIADALSEVTNHFGESIDVLINGAGGNTPKGTTESEFFNKKDLNSEVNSFFHMPEDVFKFTFDLNIVGAVLTSQVFVKHMLTSKQQVKSSIINIGSVSVPTSLTKVPAYSAAKAGLMNFTKWLATYLGKTGIRVNAIVPGFFLTAQNKHLLLNQDGSYSSRSQKIISSTPFDRFGKPEELLGAIIFLADSESSSFVTGSEIVIDGGFLAYYGV